MVLTVRLEDMRHSVNYLFVLARAITEVTDVLRLPGARPSRQTLWNSHSEFWYLFHSFEALCLRHHMDNFMGGSTSSTMMDTARGASIPPDRRHRNPDGRPCVNAEQLIRASDAFWKPTFRITTYGRPTCRMLDLDPSLKMGVL